MVALTQQEESALMEREKIKQESLEAGKGFTRLTIQRRLAEATGTIAGGGVRALRSATRKGFGTVTEERRGATTSQIVEKKTGIPLLTVEAQKIPKSRLRRALNKAREEQLRLQTQILRAKTEEEKGKLQRSFKKVKASVKEKTLELALFPSDLAKGIKEIIKKPKIIKEIPSELRKGAIEQAKLVKIDPATTVAFIGKELLILKGIGLGLRAIGKLSGRAKADVTNTLRGVKKTETQVIIPETAKGKPTIIRIVKGTKQVREPLRRQVRLAGRRVTPVSAQADKIISILKTKRVIRKPIPNEAKLNKRTKRLLAKFDQGKIGKKELIQLDIRLRRETGKAGNLLERSLFADPRGRIRKRRLGVEQDEARLIDILAGEVTFKSTKPQILIFRNVKIEKLPKSLEDVKKKLKAGITLTRSQARRLQDFQLKITGKFKPIGKLSQESEITLAPNEIIKKGKTLGFVKIGKRRIPIVETKIIKPKPKTKKLLAKARKGELSKKEIRTLEKNLKKETGFKTSLSRRGKPVRPRARIPKVIPRLRKRPRPRRKVTRKRIVPRRARVIAKVIPRTRVTRRVVRKPIVRRKAIVPRRARVPATIPRKKLKRRRVKRKEKVKKAKKGFDVFARPTRKRKKGRRPRLVKINKVPLSKRKARDLGSFVTDKSLSRTFKIKRTNKKVKKPRLKVPAKHFQRTRKKFRSFKIVKGKRVRIKNRFIEKRKSLLDTKSEKKGITLRRRIALLEKTKKKPIKKKMTSSKRKVMLKNLTKARRVKASKKKK